MAILLPQDSLVLNAYAALVGQTPGNAAYTAHKAYIATNGEAAYKAALNSVFANSTTAQLATSLLTNLGLSSIFTQAQAEAYLAANASNRVGAMMDLAAQLYSYNGSDASLVAAKAAYVNAVDGSYNYSINTANVSGATLSGTIISGGQTFTLTNTTDNFTGTSGNDTFIGDNVSASAGDTLVGGAGTDTLKLFGTAVTPNYSGIENVYYNAPGGNVDTSAKADVALVSLDAFGANTVTLANGQALKVANQAATTTVAGNSVTALNLTLDKVGTATAANNVLLNGTALTSLTITTENNASYIGLQNAGAKLTSLTVKGDKAVTINADTGTNDPQLNTIDASAMTAGGAKVTIDKDTALNITFKGGAGADSIAMAATLTSADTLDGGAGTDTVSFSDADTLTTVNTANVKNFEVLGVTTADATAYNVSNIGLTNNPLTGILISESGGGGTTVSNINSGAVGNIAFIGDTPTTIALTGADFVSGGTADTATIKLDNSVNKNADGVDVATSLTFTFADVLNVVSTSDGTAANAEQNSIAGLTATDLEKIVVTGDQSVSIITAATTVGLTEVDASAMTPEAGGGLTLNTSAGVVGALLVKATSGNDTLNVSGNGCAATIYTNGGTDALTIDSGQASTLMFTGTTTSAADLKGAVITIASATAVGDLIFNLTSALEGILKIGGSYASALSANANVSTVGLSATDSVYYSEAGGNSIIQFDLNADGVYSSSVDMQITITGGGAALTNLTYNATNDYFITA